MASLYKRDGLSPYWWIKFRDPRTGKTRRESTGLKIDDGDQTRRANELRAEKNLAELKVYAVSAEEHWDNWVVTHLTDINKAASSLKRYKASWLNLSMYLRETETHTPRQVTRVLCIGYLTWRRKPEPEKGKQKACKNTAISELILFAMIMDEAVRRGFISFNPGRGLKLRRERTKEKPEFTDEHLKLIEEAFRDEPEPMRTFYANSFAIARYQGCRLAETYLNPALDVDLDGDGESGLIRFRIKGGRDHTAPLHPKLISLFRKLKADGATETYAPVKSPSAVWGRLFHGEKLAGKLPTGACFHSLRVTAVTRLARSKTVSMSKAMRFIGHSTSLVHRVYQRLRAEDLGDCLDALD